MFRPGKANVPRETLPHNPRDTTMTKYQYEVAYPEYKFNPVPDLCGMGTDGVYRESGIIRDRLGLRRGTWTMHTHADGHQDFTPYFDFRISV